MRAITILISVFLIITIMPIQSFDSLNSDLDAGNRDIVNRSLPIFVDDSLPDNGNKKNIYIGESRGIEKRYSTIDNLNLKKEEENFIFLNYAEFDPLKVVPFVSKELGEENSQVLLVQLVDTVRPVWYNELIEYGTILGFIQKNTYIVFSKNIYEIRNLHFVRWVGPYQPAYKINPTILESHDTITVDIKLFWNFGLLSDIVSYFEELGVQILDDGSTNRIIKIISDIPTIKKIAHLPSIEWIAPSGQKEIVMDNIREYAGANEVHNHPFNGTGIVGEIKDNGINQNHPEFEGQLIGIDGNPDVQNHGTSTFGIVFASGIQERAKGMIFEGGGVFCQWDVQRYQSIRNLVNNWGGVFQSNSWVQGTRDSTYSQLSAEDDLAVFNYDITMCYGTGNNEGENACSQDSVAKNVIAIGGLNHKDNTDWSDDVHTGAQGNQGPAADGRVKPDLVGPYDKIHTTTGSSGYTDNFGGTSGATPVNAGGIGLIYQMYKENHFGNNPIGALPHASTVKAIAIADAHQYELDKADRFDQGWGHMDVGNIYEIGRNHFIVDEEINLQWTDTERFIVKADHDHPLKISLVWTDVPGVSSSSRALINDLDLTVISPSGTTYHGNYGLIDNLWSQSDGERDDINNVENVFIELPEEGEWIVEISANQVAIDGDISTLAIDQPFSLVVSGIYQEPYDISILDVVRPEYFEPDLEAIIKTKVANIGTEVGTNVIVQLLIDSEIIDQQNNGNMSPDSVKEVELKWIPSDESEKQLQVHVIPLVQEIRQANNWHNETIDVFYPKGRIVVDNYHGQEIPLLFSRELINADYQIYHSYTEIDSNTFIERTAIAVFEPSVAYNSDEQNEIKNFVEKGGGLLAIAGDDDAIVEDLTAFAGIGWSTTDGLMGVTNEIETHEITNNVESLNFETSELTIISNNPSLPIVRDELIIIPNILTAVSTVENGHVVTISDISCFDDDHLYDNDNLVFGINIAEWINDQPPIVRITTPAPNIVFTPEEIVSFSADVFDPDSVDINYQWISNIDDILSEESSFDTTLSQGIHNIYVNVSDGISNATDSITLIVNNTPEITLFEPGNGTYVEEGILNFTWNIFDFEEDIHTYILEIDNGIEKTYYNDISETYYEVDSLNIGKNHTWQVYVEDIYEREIQSEKRTFRYGNNIPKISIINPEMNERVSIIGTSLQWSVEDKDNDDLTFKLFWGVETLQLVYQGSESTYFTNELIEGEEYSWSLEVEDGYSKNFSEEMKFKVNTLPVLFGQSPENGTKLSGKEVNLSISTADLDFDDVFIRLFINDTLLPIFEGDNQIYHMLYNLSPATYNWWVELNDSFDFITSDSWNFTINTPPTIELLHPLNGLEIDSPVNFSWIGNDKDEDNISYHIYLDTNEDPSFLTNLNDSEYEIELEPGIYYWRVSVNDSFDESSSDIWSLIVPTKIPPNVFILNIEPNSTYQGETILFEGYVEDVDGNVISIEWKSNIDGFLSDAISFESSSLNLGEHIITLTATDDDGIINSTVSNLNILQVPNKSPYPIMNFFPKNPIQNESISFDLSESYDIDGTVKYYFIDFGDGTNSGWIQSSVINHIYYSHGNFIVTANVKDNQDLESIENASVEIFVKQKEEPNKAPLVHIVSINPYPAEFGDTISFDGQAEDLDGIIDSVEWTSDIDGVLSKQLIFDISSLSIGDHVITLTVIDDDGHSVSKSIELSVLPSLKPPIAVIKFTPKNPKQEEIVIFDMSESYDDDGSVTLYWIDFGDDENSGWIDTSKIEHSYSESGSYNVIVKVLDNDELESKSQYIDLNINSHEEGGDVKSEERSLGALSILLVGVSIIVVLIFLMVIRRKQND